MAKPTKEQLDRILGKQSVVQRAFDENRPTVSTQKPSNDVLNAYARGLEIAASPLNVYQVNKNVPLIGGMTAADFVGANDVQSLAQDVSYGKPVVSGGSLQTSRFDPRLMALADFIPATGVATKAAGAGAKATAKTIAKQIETGTGVFGKLTPDMKMYVLPPEKYRGETLKGMPTNIDMGGGRIEQFGTDQRIVDAANQYMADRGLLYVPQTKYATVDPVRAKKIAEAFDKMKDQPNNFKVKKAYDALIEETLGQYEAARKAGVKFEFMPEGQDLYGNPRNAINDIVTNKHMYVFPTESGFGSVTEALAANPLLQRTGEKWNGKNVTANDVFRAVHDYFGHAKKGVGFRATGEENAWQSHARMYSPTARPAATSETRGQNSYVNFGKYGKQNQSASPLDTIYADQKTGLMPDWTMIEGLLD